MISKGRGPEWIGSVDAEAVPIGVDVACNPVVAPLLVDEGRTGAQGGHMVLGTLEIREPHPPVDDGAGRGRWRSLHLGR